MFSLGIRDPLARLMVWFAGCASLSIAAFASFGAMMVLLAVYVVFVSARLP